MKYEERARQPHAVYRCWDAEGVLLYIGCSYQPERRWRTWLSKRDVAWPRETVRRELTWYPSLWRGQSAESDAIRDEGPLHNVYCQLPPEMWSLDMHLWMAKA